MQRLISNILKTFCVVSCGTAVKFGLVHGVMYTTELAIVPSVPLALLVMSIIIGTVITVKQ